MAGQSRVNARKATLTVQDILQKKSDETHRMSIMDIVREAQKQPYDIKIHRDTVKSILADLQEFYSDTGEICCEVTERKNAVGDDVNDYTYNYYWKSKFSNEEIHMLIDDILFSKMRTKEQVKNITEKLKSLVSENYSKKLGYTSQIPEKQYTVNKLTQNNIADIHQIIAKNAYKAKTELWVEFTFNGYGTDKKLHPAGRFQVLPLRICEANKRYYLICYLRGSKNLSHFRIDLMTDLKATEVSIEKDDDRKQVLSGFNAKTVSEYLSSHPYMFYESSGNDVKMITLRVNKIPGKPKGSMTLLYDMFGENWEVVAGTESDKTVDVIVRAVPSGMEVFARQYQDRVKIL